MGHTRIMLPTKLKRALTSALKTQASFAQGETTREKMFQAIDRLELKAYTAELATFESPEARDAAWTEIKVVRQGIPAAEAANRSALAHKRAVASARIDLQEKDARKGQTFYHPGIKEYVTR